MISQYLTFIITLQQEIQIILYIQTQNIIYLQNKVQKMATIYQSPWIPDFFVTFNLFQNPFPIIIIILGHANIYPSPENGIRKE